MVFTQHQKFLLKHQKYCSTNDLKISEVRFYDQSFYGSSQNLRSALSGRFFARNCFLSQPSSRPKTPKVMLISVSSPLRPHGCGSVYGFITSSLAFRFTPCKAMGNYPSNYSQVIGKDQKKRYGSAYHAMKMIFFQTKTFYRLKFVRHLSIFYQGKSCKFSYVISHLNCYPLPYIEKNYRWKLGKQWISIKKNNYKLNNSIIKNYIIYINESSISILAKRQRFITNSLKGILLVNFPEKEKNFLIKNLAAENKIPLITQSASLLLKDSRNMDDLLGVDDPIQILFDKVKTCIPCICFINNLDSIGRQRYEHLRLGKPKSLDWLNYSISLLINNNMTNEMIASKPIHKPMFSTSVSKFVRFKDQKPLPMHLQFDKPAKKLLVTMVDPTLFKQNKQRNIFKYRRVQSFKCFKTKAADFDFKPHHLKLIKNKQKFRANYYHRFPVWLCNFKFICQHPCGPKGNFNHPINEISGHTDASFVYNNNKQKMLKTSTKKIKWFGFYNNLYTISKVNFYLQSSESVAWKFWVFNKRLTSPMKINFFQSLSSKIQLVSKKAEFKTLIASASAFKTQTSFVISKLKQQNAEKKSLRFLSISDHLLINSLSSPLLFIDYFSQTKPIKTRQGTSTYDPYTNTNSNEFISQNFLRQSNRFEMLINKIERIPKINTNFISSSKKKNLMITNDYGPKGGYNSLLSNYNYPAGHNYGPKGGYNSLLSNYNYPAGHNYDENKIIISKISEIPNKTNTRRLISKQSQLDQNLKAFFLATVFDNAQARSGILFKRVLTKDIFNPSKQNNILKTNSSLIQNQKSITGTLSTNQEIQHNKNNSCELDR